LGADASTDEPLDSACVGSWGGGDGHPGEAYR
jgi:hypothetical protein